MTHSYREFAPPEQLASHVACFWTEFTGDEERPPFRVMPDGCIDILWIDERRPVVVGPMTTADIPSLPPHASIVAVRFRPGMATHVLGVPAHTLLNVGIPLKDIWSAEAYAPASHVGERATIEERLGAAKAAVSSRIAVTPAVDGLIPATTEWLAQRPLLTIRETADRAGLSERQLLRRFESAVGYGPKTLHRVLRFQRWLRLARDEASAAPVLAHLAMAAGYADQPHMTREVTKLAGLPPAALLAELGPSTLSDPFKTEAAAR